MAYQPKSYKKFVATAATATLVASAIAPVASAATFTDVNKNYTEAVNYLVANKIAQGTSETTFGTTASITRGDAAVMIANALGLDTSKAPESAFTDLNTRVKASVNALSAAGIINGKSTTQFAPADNITRAEMAKVIALAYKLDKTGTTNEFTDVNSTFDEYVDALVKHEITLGKTESLFGATQNVTRGEFALFVFRAENLTPATPEVVSVSAINATQAVVTFAEEVGTATATNFTADNGLTVIKAEIDSENKKAVTLTFNKAFTDKTDYKVTVNGVKSVKGAEMTEATTSEFTYEIGEVSTIELTKSTFINADDIADFVELTNAKGIDVTEEYTVEITSTSPKVTAGVVSGVTASETAYVQVIVKDANGDTVKSSDAFKVTLASSAITTLVGFGLGDNVATEAAFKTAVKDGDLISEMKKSDTPFLELLVKNNGEEQLLTGADVSKIENLTPTVATVSKDVNGDLVVTAFSTGTASVKLTSGDFVTTISFTVKADSKVTSATLDQTSVYFNTALAPNDTATVNVNIADQYNKAIKADVVGATGAVTIGSSTYTMSVKSSNNNIATVAINDATDVSALPITITEVGKGNATITVDLKAANGTVVFTKTLTVTGKDAGALAGYAIETDSTLIDLDNDSAEASSDDAVNFMVYEVDAQGNKIQAATGVTLEVQGYASAPEVSNYLVVNGTAVEVANANATEFKTFAGTGTLNVDVKVNGTKVGTKAITYKNTDSVATKAVVNTSSVVIDNDKITATPDAALNVEELLTGHFEGGKYTVAPKLSVQDQLSSVIDFDTTSMVQGTLVTTDVVSGLTYTLTNVSSNLSVTGSNVSLVAGKASGTFTVVVSKIDTDQVSDILEAPVAFNVTIVE